MKIININNFKDEPSKIVGYDEGGLWEDKDWAIHYNQPVQDLNCKHCGKKFIVRNYDINKEYKEFYKKEYIDYIYTICPRVIVTCNEGGYCSTGICLDCLLEKIPQKN